MHLTARLRDKKSVLRTQTNSLGSRSCRAAQLCPALDQIVPECACTRQTRELQQLTYGNVRAYSRRQKSAGRRAKESGQAPTATTAADAVGLLQVLVQLASRTTIILGSHQAYVSVIRNKHSGCMPASLPCFSSSCCLSSPLALPRDPCNVHPHLLPAPAAFPHLGIQAHHTLSSCLTAPHSVALLVMPHRLSWRLWRMYCRSSCSASPQTCCRVACGPWPACSYSHSRRW
jgi:hypothetical protein